MKVVPIVEGHGEVDAVPVLVRRVAAALGQYPECERPIRVPRSRLIRPEEFENAVELAWLRAGENGLVLVMLDADDDCPATLGPELLDLAARVRPRRSIGVVVARCEFEAWFLAAAESLAGHRDLPLDLTAPDDPESIRDAKGWLSMRMRAVRPGGYRETRDQAALAALFDMDLARLRSRSFRKLWAELERYLTG
jgi:hypothetical protein